MSAPSGEVLPDFWLSNLRTFIHESATYPFGGHDADGECCRRVQAGLDEYVESQVAAARERREARRGP